MLRQHGHHVVMVRPERYVQRRPAVVHAYRGRQPELCQQELHDVRLGSHHPRALGP